MVKITNSKGDILEVTSGAFESVLKKQGYTVVAEKSVKQEKSNDQNKSKNSGDSGDKVSEDDLAEKPVSMWSKAEVRDYAAKHDIDLSGTTFNEAKALVKAHMGIK